MTPYSFRLVTYTNHDGDAFTTLAQLTTPQQNKTVVALKYLALAWHIVTTELEPTLAAAYRRPAFVSTLLERTLTSIREFQAAVPSPRTRRRFFGEAVVDRDTPPPHGRTEPIEYTHGHAAFVWNINYLEAEAAIEELYKRIHGEEVDPTPATDVWLRCWNGTEAERVADGEMEVAKNVKEEPPVESNDAACKSIQI